MNLHNQVLLYPFNPRLALSLRFRLNLMIGLTLLIIVGVGTLFVVHNARRSVLEEVRSSIDMALQMVEVGLARSAGPQQALAAWLAELGRMEKIRHFHIQMRQPTQSPTDLSHDTPKHAGSLAPNWFAWAVTPTLMVGEKQVVNGAGEPVRIVIEANPADEIDEAWIEARSFLVFMVALAAAVSGLVHITLGRAFKSVGHILRGMEDIEQGDYGKRLPHFDLAEFDRISAAFNHMAQALAKSRDENRALASHSLRVQEDERRYLAQELHDELGQSLSAIKVMAASLRNTPRQEHRNERRLLFTSQLDVRWTAEHYDGDNPHREAAETIMHQCDRLFGVVRGMMRRLHPLMLDELGLIPSLQDLIENWRTRHPDIDIFSILDEGVEAFVGSAKIHLFRIVQESLTNISKHADAKTVWIELALMEGDSIYLKVADDGKGFDPALPRTGFGLHGIHERVVSMNGQLALETDTDRGVSLEIIAPCHA